ncbi:hypothetical protein [Streptomyces mirabilis]|uniref:hypothetical protein n=1 Tax=Streptomyces mirabilis TaxID=68239 RepID=UPI0033A3E2AF
MASVVHVRCPDRLPENVYRQVLEQLAELSPVVQALPPTAALAELPPRSPLRSDVTGTSSGSSSTTSAYTARGTLASVTGSQGTENLSYDAFDQLTQDGSTAYGHDDLGL